MAQTELQLKINDPLQICVKRRGAIGDVIMTTPVVRELKAQYGDNAAITVATDCPQVYANNPHIRGVVKYDDAKLLAFDTVYNLDDIYERNPHNHYIDSMLYSVFGRADLDRTVELFPSDADREVVDQDLQTYGDKFIVVHMRNWHWGAKNINMEVWFDILLKLFDVRVDFTVVCVGGPTDNNVDHPLIFDARAKYTDQQLKYLCDHAACFVGIDSAPFWCASASSTHVIGLLTHLHPERIMPTCAGGATAVPTLEDCRGCNDVQKTPVRQIVCSKGNTPCTNNFDTTAIAQAILETL